MFPITQISISEHPTDLQNNIITSLNLSKLAPDTPLRQYSVPIDFTWSVSLIDYHINL